MVEQINDLLRLELSKLINQNLDLPDVLITISYVQATSDLQHAKIAVSVLPEKMANKAITELKKKSSFFSKQLKEKTRLRKIPSFYWVFDKTEAKAAELDEIFKQIEAERN